MQINVEVVEKLIATQFPQWSNIPISPVEKSGNDNRTFHLGDKMTIRLPSAECYVPQVEKEYKWLPFLQKHLTLPISSPITKGCPNDEYPFPWTINHYIDGITVNYENIISLNSFAVELSSFLRELQAIDTSDAPQAGQHNFYRGGDLSIYHGETVLALKQLENSLPVSHLEEIWQNAISSKWDKPPVWIHGDIANGNLLVTNGHLSGVIDFGIMGIGDPACDYAMAWTFFKKDSRDIFLENLSSETVNRAKGWALWKALITYTSDANAKNTIQEIMFDC